MNTDHHVQHNQMQTNFVFELARVAREVLFYEQEVNLEVRESSGLLERGQIKNQFQDGSASFALRVGSPKLRNDRGSNSPNDGSSIPIVVVEESVEGTWTFDWGVFGSGVAVCFEESCDQRVERLELVIGGDEGLDGVEYGSGFFVQRTVSLLVGT